MLGIDLCGRHVELPRGVPLIQDSAPWKKRLASDADLIERWAGKRAITERRSVLIEQKVFLAAYAMRKLIEAQKLSTSFSDRSLRCQAFNAGTERVTRINNHCIDKLYDLEKPHERDIGVRSFLDTIIHSLVFAEALDNEMRVSGFFVTSDNHKRVLLFVALSHFTKLLRDASTDYPAVMAFVRDDREPDGWFSWRGHGDPPHYVQEKAAKACVCPSK